MSADPLADPLASAVPGGSLSGAGVTSPSLSGAGGRFLSDIVVELGFVDPEVAEEAVHAGRRPGYTPERVLLESGAITEDQLSRALAERYGLDHIDLSEFAVDDTAAGLLREHAARRYQAVPVGFTDEGTLIVAVSDPADSLGLTDIAVMTKLAVRPAVASRSQIDGLLDTLHFMEEPVVPGPQTIGTVIVPPEEEASDEGTQALRIAPLPRTPAAVTDGRVEELERELAETEEALADARTEHERALAELRSAHDEALRETRTAADRQVAKAEAEHDGALADLKGAHELALADERARRTAELESERGRTGSAIDAERERHQKELEALRVRSEQVLEDERAAAAKELERERERQEQVLAEGQARSAEKLELEAARQASELEAVTAKHAAEIEAERARAEQRLAGAQAATTREVEAARAEAAQALEERLEQTLEAERAAQAEKAGELRDRLATERARAEELAARLDEVSGDSEQVAVLGQRLEQAEASLREARESAARDAEETARAAAEALEEAKAASAAELERERAAHAESVGELRDRLASESARVEELEAGVEELETRLAQTPDHSEQLAVLEQKLERAEASVRETRESAARNAEETARAAAEALDQAKAAAAAELDQALAETERLRGELELLTEADRRAEEARAALTELREESERQAELHSLIERDLGAELRATRERNEVLESRLQDMQEKIADATKAFEAMGSAERRLNEIAASFPRADADADRADDQPAG